MKNYYEILGVSTDATQEEIKNAYNNIPDTLKTSDTTDAYKVLSDDQSRKEYDEKLKAKEEKKSPVKKLMIYAGIFFALGGTVALANKISNDKTNNTKVEGTVTPGVTEEPEDTLPTVTPAPEQSIDEVKPTVAPTSTPEPTKAPIAYEDVKVINSETIDVVVNHLAEEYAEKGLEIDIEELKSVLTIANISSMEKEYLANIDFDKLLKKANDGSDKITSHNIRKLEKNEKSKYISTSELYYNETAKKVIKYSEGFIFWVEDKVENKTLTEKECSKAFEYFGKFADEKGNFVIDNKEMGYMDIPAEARYGIEKLVGPTILIEFTNCGKANIETITYIGSVQRTDFDGVRYVSELRSYVPQKQLTK